MSNPFLIAAKGKGFFPMLQRGRVIASRYGLTPGKMDDAIAALLKPLSGNACSATLPVTASALAANPAAAKKLALEGLELAVHGLHHLDYSLLSMEKQVEHFKKAQGIFQRLNIAAQGFRCPYLRWNADTLTALKETGFTYDSSQALAWDVVGNQATDGYRRALDFYRAQSANEYPALPGYSGSLIRIPYSLPDDEALVDRLQISEPEPMAEIWLAMLERAYQNGELFTLGLHPERAPLCQQALHAVLVKARSLIPRVWIARLDEIAAWYRSLGEVEFDLKEAEADRYSIKINAPKRAVVLFRNMEVMAPTEAWTAGYRLVSSKRFTFRSEKRPLVGVAPGSPAALHSFLRHQGYLVEVSALRDRYGLYLDRSVFQPQDERPLLAELEGARGPLVRVSRWPSAARCALTVTGDVDAFTVLDFGRRILAG